MSNFKAGEWLRRFRVRAGSVVVIAVILLARPTWGSMAFGVGISFLGLFIRAWASGHLRKEKRLAISGPYRYSRNPLYLGNFFLGTGIVVGSRSWWVFGLFAAYFIFFYPLIIRKEREKMKTLFPDQYEEYRRRVPPFFPSFLRRHQPSQEKFSWALYKRNKEYRALIGTMSFWLVLALKILLLNR
jgi:protein-S-isoprenylcysteine O-methyltransferase Ste14